LLQTHGFALELLTYVNMLLFPLALAKRLGERVFPGHGGESDLSLHPGPLGTPLRLALSAEAALIGRVRLPFGLSVLALGRKS
jgi:hypothetical protein